VPADGNGNERLGRLLGLLRPAPEGWVGRAKRIFVEAGDVEPRAAEPLTERDVWWLTRALERDAGLRSRFDADPVAAADAAGMPELAAALEQELRELVALAERVAADDAYRAALETDPMETLGSAGVDAAAVESVLDALGVSDDVLSKVPEVVAHGQQTSPRGAGLLMALLTSDAAVDEIRAAARGA
jgi:hypothetical protein